MQRLMTDAVVVGGGLAGLWAALHLPDDWEVVVVDKAAGTETGSSPWAQGGMAVPVATDDSAELHIADTVRAGAGASSVAAVEVLVSEAQIALDELVTLGCGFDRTPDGGFDLNHEGGQSVPRSVHAADATGREIMRVVVEHARRRARRLVGTVSAIVERDGLCRGVLVDTGEGPVSIGARGVLVATGGCGALYGATTNPSSATGDAVTLAVDAGAVVADLEFVQFHPTALAAGGHRRVLLTEALRGAGAVVVDEAGERFLLDVHPEGELGPRDVIARAIAEQQAAWLDARPIGADEVRRRFPHVTAAVAGAGFDLTAEQVPVAPAAHYSLGGVSTDLWGRTTLSGLYAAGECAATGVHGANRMAGNSLTEAVVFGRRAAIAMSRELDRPVEPLDGPSPPLGTAHTDGWSDLREAMTRGAGLVRTEQTLREAESCAGRIATESRDPDLVRAARAAALCCRAARARRESRGVHHRTDAPEPDDAWEGVHISFTAGRPY